MSGKGRIACGLLVIVFMASPAFATYVKMAPWAHHVTHHWFDSDAWAKYGLLGWEIFTWDPNRCGNYAQVRDLWMDPGTYLLLDSNPSDPNVGYNNYCDIILNIFSVAKNDVGEWMEFHMDDANMYIGDPVVRPDGSWNPLGIGKEGWGKVIINDSLIECDTVHLSEYASPSPNAYDPNDPNNDADDPNTWTGAWPAHENQLILTGTTRLQLFEAGFFWRMGGQHATPSNRASFVQFGPDVAVITAPPDDGGTPADPNDDRPGTHMHIRNKATMEWVIGSTGYCTVVHNGDATFEAGSMVSAIFSGVLPPLVPTNYTVMTIAGTITNSGPLDLHPTMPTNWSLIVGSGAVVLTYHPIGYPCIEDVNLFYNNSYYDSASDDNAIDISKNAGLPGLTASYANVSNYGKGINGIMIDISYGAITAADLTIQQSGVSNGSAIGDYGAGPVPISVTTRAGAGKSWSDRVDVIFADTDVNNARWLRVTVASNANTKLVAPYTFYYGLAVGDTGDNAPTDFRVDASDRLGCRANLNPGFPLKEPVTCNYDFNRDGAVDASDRLIARAHLTGFLTDLAAGITFP
ncbi:MAG: hypothetical protein ACYSTL_02485 [Planctomycetota bacterium]|jgi:hypothetical protein